MRPTPLLLTSVFFLACADSTPPTWPSEGDLEVVEAGTHSVELRWPEASDEEGVSGYRIRKEGAFLTQVAPTVTQAEVTGLDEAATVRLSVEAVDFAGNTSEPLFVDVTTGDGTAPSWPAGAALTATAEGEALLLEWTAAEDNRAVTGYVVMRAAEVLGQPGADATSFRTTGSPEGLEIRAVDEAGNRSVPLRATVEQAEVEQAEVEQTEVSSANPAQVQLNPAAAAAVRDRLTPALQRSLKSGLRYDRLRLPLGRSLGTRELERPADSR